MKQDDILTITNTDDINPEEKDGVLFIILKKDLKKGDCIKVDLESAKKELVERIERLDIQLAGCSVAALGYIKEPAKPKDYGWSPSYQDVLDLRKKFDSIIPALQIHLKAGGTNTIQQAIEIIKSVRLS